jgi:hypothetical protein
MRAFKLYTGADNASHLVEGELTLDRRTDVLAVHFEESPTHSAFDWHEAIDEEPWRRCYVVLKAGAPDLFVPKR